MNEDGSKTLVTGAKRLLFNTSNSSLCNADSMTKRLHRDYNIAMAGFNEIDDYVIISNNNNILIIDVDHSNIRSIHGDLITPMDSRHENLKYNPSIMFWDIETTSTSDNSVEI
jgi:hypothetical protein